MTTFEGIIYGIIHGLTEFLPIGGHAHRILAGHLLGFPEPGAVSLGALSVGAALALLVAFRHDWASMTSSLLQVIIFRKYPMTLDERMPFFMLLTCLPVGGAWYYLKDRMEPSLSSPTGAALTILGGAALIWIAERYSRKIKNTYDMNWLDAAASALGLSLFMIPGLGWLTGTITVGLIRNYRTDASVKYAYFCALPLTIASAAFHLRGVDLHSSAPDGVSWLTLSSMILVTFLSGLFTISGFSRHSQRKTLDTYVIYRTLLGLGMAGWIRFKGDSA